MIEQLLSEPRLTRIARDIAALARECVRFESRAMDEGEIAVGASKLGGRPDLPAETPWPRKAGVPLAFVAQINTSELRSFTCTADLPPDTLLTFFYDAAEQPSGYDPADRGSWRVLATPLGSSELTRRNHPPRLESEPIFNACVLMPSLGISLPPADSEEVHALSPTDDEFDAYDRVLSPDSAWELHQLLGHPQVGEFDMMMMCQLASNGAFGPHDPRYEALAPGAAQWRLLLQIGSDEKADMCWGDVGNLYFCITEDALRRRDFDQVWLGNQGS